MLILFDIDMTLVQTRGAGIEALEAAGRELFTPAFDAESIAYGGRIDPVIFAELLEVNGVSVSHKNVDLLQEGYAARLPALLPGRAQAMPGAVELVDAVTRSSAMSGVLTGNVEPTGAAKLEAAGFEVGHFRVRVWGDDSPHDPPERDHLPPVALDRYRDLTGKAIDAGSATIVGDTIHDVACAKAHGLRCLAVATGKWGGNDLAEAGADLVVDDLTDTAHLTDWLLQ